MWLLNPQISHRGYTCDILLLLPASYEHTLTPACFFFLGNFLVSYEPKT